VLGCEVDDDLCAGSDGSGDLDVEQDFGVGAVGVGWTVLAVVHRDCGYGRRRETERFEVVCDVRLLIAAAQLNDADGLACAVDAGRKVIELRNLNRRVRDADGGGISDRLYFAKPKVGVRLRAIIETENSLNDIGQFDRQVD